MSSLLRKLQAANRHELARLTADSSSGHNAQVEDRVPLPRPVGGAIRSGPFVGREAERELLAEAYRGAAAGGGQVVLTRGSPVSGKTRLAGEAAQAAHQQGALVLLGRCDEGMGMPFQPFVEALDTFAVHTADSRLAGALGRLGRGLVRLLPELSRRLPQSAPPLRADPETERHRVFEAVAGWLARSASDQPVVLVIDDLHWATIPTLLLLRHLARASATTRLVLIATYRDTEVDPDHPLTDLLADLQTTTDLTRVKLHGLTQTDVSAMITPPLTSEATSSGLSAGVGDEFDEQGRGLARVIHVGTGGNPLFVGEVIRHLRESGALLGASGQAADLVLPEGVRGVIGRRLRRLPEAAQRALTVAALIGVEFDLDLLGQVTAGTEDELLDTLDQALTAQLIIEFAGRPGRYAFSHDLVRATLADALTAAQRARLHGTIGAAIEARYAENLDEHLAALAFHYGEAAAYGNRTRAADYALRAGLQARDRLAFDEARAVFERGLHVTEGEPGLAQVLRCELLIALADSFDHPLEGKAPALDAVELARRLKSPTLLAQAAAVYPYAIAVGPDPLKAHLCEEALAGLGNENPALRSLVLATLAVYRGVAESQGDAADGLALEAVQCARLATAAPSSPGEPGRRNIVWELGRLDESHSAKEILFSALMTRHAVLVGSGACRTAWRSLRS